MQPLLYKLINKQMLSGIMGRMPQRTGSSGSKRGLSGSRDSMEEAYWFVDQKWRDSLDVVTAEPQVMDYGQEMRKNNTEGVRCQIKISS
jgi:hypothetical protein